MSTWQNHVMKDGYAPVWPHPLRYDKQQEIKTGVLMLGGGISGCWAAISAPRPGVMVAMLETSAAGKVSRV
jgi:heterodisulfide reductase subunit A-like polyferredoxin